MRTYTYRHHVNGKLKVDIMTHDPGHVLPKFLRDIADVLDTYGVTLNAGTKFAFLDANGTLIDVVLTYDQPNITGAIMRQIAQSKENPQPASLNKSARRGNVPS